MMKKPLTILLALVSVLVLLVVLDPIHMIGHVVEGRRHAKFQQDLERAVVIIRKTVAYEKLNANTLPSSVDDLAAVGIIDAQDLHFLHAHKVRYYPAAHDDPRFAVRFEMLIANRRVLGLPDGSVTWVEDDAEGYATIALDEFIDNHRSRLLPSGKMR